MSGKGFGTEVQIPSEHLSHPKDTDEMLHLKREVEGYVRPGMHVAGIFILQIVNTKDIKLAKTWS